MTERVTITRPADPLKSAIESRRPVYARKHKVALEPKEAEKSTVRLPVAEMGPLARKILAIFADRGFGRVH